jgi:AcrR family transcriptional regulator
MARAVAARGGTRSRILRTAGRLFAERGYRGTSIDELGAAAGISGPGLYKHFPNKEALLGELLVGVSERLLAGGKARLAEASGDGDALARLVDFHLAFALGEPELILVQDRDWGQLCETDRRSVRRLQRAYVEIWTSVLQGLRPDLDHEHARACVQAVFGLMNSTPHSVGNLPRSQMSQLLRTLALAALLDGGREPGPATVPATGPAGRATAGPGSASQRGPWSEAGEGNG